MLIGFSGPSGSGKTTLVRRLEKLVPNSVAITEVAREVFREYATKYGTLGELRRSDEILEFQLRVLEEQLTREKEATREYDYVFVDRTVYDNLFFTTFYHGENFDLLSQYVELFERRNEYDLIFLCKSVDDDVDDGFRTTDVRYRKFQELVITSLLPFEPFVLPSFSNLPTRVAIEKRCEICLNVLELKEPDKPLYTVGYQEKSIDEFVSELKSAGVERVIDVRYRPLSRRKDFCKSRLEKTLTNVGIEYFSVRRAGAPTFLRNVVGYVSPEDFEKSYLSIVPPDAVAEVARLASEKTSAILCYEKDWRNCHRRALAKALRKYGFRVIHL